MAVTEVPHDPVRTALDRIAAEVDQLGDVNWTEYTGTEAQQAVEQLARLSDRLAGIDAGAVDRFSRSSEWQPAGFRSARAAVAYRCDQSQGTSGRRTKRATALRELDLIADALVRGDISIDKADLLLRIDRGKVHDRLVEAQQMLLGYAKKLTYKQFKVAVRRFEDAVDPDGSLSDAEKAERNRRLRISPTFDGGNPSGSLAFRLRRNAPGARSPRQTTFRR